MFALYNIHFSVRTASTFFHCFKSSTNLIKVLYDCCTSISHMFNEVRNTSSDINTFSFYINIISIISIEGQTISYSHSK
nr:MAG TPA: hypothetical protein [Caudoviricetes sp.]